jgi:hypothetical protein
VKKVMKKAHSSGNNIQQALLHLRITPISKNIPSPAQMLFGRRIKSSIVSKVTNTLAEKEEIHEQLTQRQQTQKHHFDKHARRDNLPTLMRDQRVLVQNPKTLRWEPAAIHDTTSDARSYIVRMANGNLVRRNRQHIRDIPNTELVPPTAIEPASNTHSNATSTAIPDTTASAATAMHQEPGVPSRQRQASEDVYRTRSGRASKKPQRYSAQGK